MDELLLMNTRFKLTVPVVEVFKRKDADGEETMVVRGLASSIDVDLEHERMSRSAIDSMLEAIKLGRIDPLTGEWTHIPLQMGHDTEWYLNLGWITKGEVDEHYNLWIEAELDSDSPDAIRLWKQLTRKPKAGKQRKLGLSVGGFVKQVGKEWVETLQKHILVYLRIDLDEITVTSRPANAQTVLGAMTKSLVPEDTDWKTVDMEDLFEMTKSLIEDQTAIAEPTEVEKTAVAEVATDAVVEKTTDETVDPSEETVAKTDSADSPDETVQKTEDAQPAEQVAKTDASGIEADETVSKAVDDEVEQEVAKELTDPAAADSAEATMNAALLEAANEAIAQIAQLANAYSYLRYEVDYVMGALIGKGLVSESDVAKARADARGEAVQKSETSEAEETVAKTVEETADEVVEETVAKQVITDASEGDTVIKAADVTKMIAEAVSKETKALLDRIDTLERTPVDRSVVVQRQKSTEAEDVITKHMSEIEGESDPRKRMRKAMSALREINGGD